ncbi:unnamed protein product [Urochloa humidicola]
MSLVSGSKEAEVDLQHLKTAAIPSSSCNGSFLAVHWIRFFGCHEMLARSCFRQLHDCCAAVEHSGRAMQEYY